jgi:hypothetical protein
MPVLPISTRLPALSQMSMISRASAYVMPPTTKKIKTLLSDGFGFDLTPISDKLPLIIRRSETGTCSSPVSLTPLHAALDSSDRSERSCEFCTRSLIGVSKRKSLNRLTRLDTRFGVFERRFEEVRQRRQHRCERLLFPSHTI